MTDGELKGHATDGEWLSFLQYHPVDRVKAAYAEITRLRVALANAEENRETYKDMSVRQAVELGSLRAENEKLREERASIIERCAKVCEARYMGDNNREDMEAKRCAAAIREIGGSRE